MQGQDHHADHVFPEKCVSKQVFAIDHFFPDGARDHDGVKHQGFDHHRRQGPIGVLTGFQAVQYQVQTDQKNQKLNRRQDTLNQCPLGCITSSALLWRVQSLGLGLLHL